MVENLKGLAKIPSKEIPPHVIGIKCVVKTSLEDTCTTFHFDMKRDHIMRQQFFVLRLGGGTAGFKLRGPNRTLRRCLKMTIF